MIRRLSLPCATLFLLAPLSGCVMTFKPPEHHEPNARMVNSQVADLLEAREQYDNEARLAAR